MAQRVGEILAEERSLKGVSIADVSEHTHIRSAFLTALEQSDYEALPAIGHTKGFVISYAQYLGLDANALAARIAEEIRAQEPEKSRGAFDRAKQTDRTSTDTHEIPRRLVWILLTAIVLIGALAWGISTFWRAENESGPKAPLRTTTTLDQDEQVEGDERGGVGVPDLDPSIGENNGAAQNDAGDDTAADDTEGE